MKRLAYLLAVGFVVLAVPAQSTIKTYAFTGTAAVSDPANLLGDLYPETCQFFGTFSLGPGWENDIATLYFPGFSVSGGVHEVDIYRDSSLYLQPLFFSVPPNDDNNWDWGEAGAHQFLLDNFSPCPFWFFYVYDYAGIIYPDSGTEISFSGTIDSLKLNPVPEPSTMVLVSIGIIALIAVSTRWKLPPRNPL